MGVSNPLVVPKGDIVVSSFLHAKNCPPWGARFSTTPKDGGSWCSRPDDADPALTIDLKSHCVIKTISTRGKSSTNIWVSRYLLTLKNISGNIEFEELVRN